MDKVLVSCTTYFRNVNLTLLNVTQIDLSFWSHLERIGFHLDLGRENSK